MASHFRSTERQGSEGDEQLDVISDVAPQEVATSAEEAVETISESIDAPVVPEVPETPAAEAPAAETPAESTEAAA